ncbi:glycosyl transferase family 2 [Skermanella stibiiresistens SB22]|uniref:Glycosyl transferase family 2 n=1 Tax=Skermanella stibiiresistens SB22 TaxID=1385369 RepID=W9H5N0_9PROT|nr:glycosyltransferase family 2 protein [Skermanella stibiiresistens]EWY41349.1 glycosyl transferase family 2 [Skermanella stibiiresistens SB22]
MSKVIYLDSKRRRQPPVPADPPGAPPEIETPSPARPSRPLVTVVMVSYHTGPVLEDAIAAVLAQDIAIELILVDNGNPAPVTAGLVARCAEDPRIKLATGHGNIGFAAACNLGAKDAQGDFLLLLNPDCVLDHGALADLIRLIPKTAHPWVAGCRIVNPDGTDQRGSRRELPTPWLTLVEALRLDRLAPNHPYFRRLNQHDQPIPEAVTQVPAVSGACMLMPVDDYRMLGGMDEGYFLHVEDLDLCFAMTRMGGSVLFVPQVSLIHYRSTSDASIAKVEWFKAKGFTRYFRKNFTGLYPSLFLTAVNCLVWLYFLMRLSSLARTAVTDRLSRMFRRAKGDQAADPSDVEARKRGRKGWAA